MNNEQLREVFMYGLTRVQVDDDDGLAGNQPADLALLARLAELVKADTGDGDTLHTLMLHRLASCTLDMIEAPSWQTTHDWLIARSELLQTRLSGA